MIMKMMTTKRKKRLCSYTFLVCIRSDGADDTEKDGDCVFKACFHMSMKMYPFVDDGVVVVVCWLLKVTATC